MSPLLASLGVLVALGSPGVPCESPGLDRPAKVGRAAHPQDGPHGDLTVRIGRSRVRVQVQMNLVFADELVDTFREDANVLDPVEEEDLRADLIDWMAEHTEVVIDGQPTAFGPLAAWEVAPPDLSRLPYYPRFGARALTALRLELSYPTEAPPERVALSWGGYPPNLTVAPDGVNAPPLTVRARFSGYGYHEAVDLSVESPSHEWVAPPPDQRLRLEDVPPPLEETSSPWRLPSSALGGLTLGLALLLAMRGAARARVALAATCGALLVVAALLAPPTTVAALPDPTMAREVFLQLHQNLYRAFGFTEDEDVYDGLARTVAPELLDELYQEIHDGLVQQEHGGAVSEVELVTPLATEVVAIGHQPPGDRPAFQVRATWQVQGAVHHFGHYHRRTTEYEANYGVIAGDEGWRVHSTEVLAQRRVSDETDDPNAGADPNERGAPEAGG